MWEQYKKTARYMQSFILLACVAIYFITRQPMAVVIFFGVMQFAALFGAAWGARIKYHSEQMARRRNELPLERRR
jgi:uncharacterized membrane protein